MKTISLCNLNSELSEIWKSPKKTQYQILLHLKERGLLLDVQENAAEIVISMRKKSDDVKIIHVDGKLGIAEGGEETKLPFNAAKADIAYFTDKVICKITKCK